MLSSICGARYYVFWGKRRSVAGCSQLNLVQISAFLLKIICKVFRPLDREVQIMLFIISASVATE